MTNLPTISAEQFAQRLRERQLNILDVRTPLEYRHVHVDGSRNEPLDRLNPSSLADQMKPSEDDPIYILCKSGGRASRACERLIAAGCENVIVVEGGVTACEQAGVPVTRGKKAMSLERQTRVVAGSLVAFGSALAFFVSPWLLIIPAGVGLGLLHAGLTDSCAMGMLLAKMPWSQVSSTASVNDGQSCSV